eukprot:TRINITY_DN11895_c0_g1_i1.p1 TRINITY_DN11895_c0_g1~~TRINITY_DN11895_c0_g1_i1.p1  ORF type:complete len:160 (+),score=22.97 TRINITY_DN11895_c0_g1_i1:178-657(+)
MCKMSFLSIHKSFVESINFGDLNKFETMLDGNITKYINIDQPIKFQYHLSEPDFKVYLFSHQDRKLSYVHLAILRGDYFITEKLIKKGATWLYDFGWTCVSGPKKISDVGNPLGFVRFLIKMYSGFTKYSEELESFKKLETCLLSLVVEDFRCLERFDK